jgi:hypothetical protein
MLQRLKLRYKKEESRILWLTKEMVATHSLITRRITGLPSVVLLNGYPGVGKLTIARALNDDLENSQLIDNNLLVELADAIEPLNTPANAALRTAIRHAAFDGIKAVTNKLITVIMTTCTLSNVPADLELFAELVDIARVRGVPFVSVNINCDSDVNVRRLASEAREHVLSKLMDPQVLLDMRSKYTLLDPRQCEMQIHGVKVHHKELDVTILTAEKSAAAIMTFLTEGGHADVRI